MTRRKKTRSLKQIHSVKTGSRSKLQKVARNDRQHKRRYRGKKQQSVYEQHLAAEKAQASLTPQATDGKDSTTVSPPKPANNRKPSRARAQPLPPADKAALKVPAVEITNRLWGQLDHNKLNKDLY